MFKLKIETDNAAFRDPYCDSEDECDPAHVLASREEVARILRKVADKVESDCVQGAVYDANGNRVGNFGFH